MVFKVELARRASGLGGGNGGCGNAQEEGKYVVYLDWVERRGVCGLELAGGRELRDRPVSGLILVG